VLKNQHLLNLMLFEHLNMGELKTLVVACIVYSYDKATFLYTWNKRSYAVDYSLDELQLLLDPESFFRINRSYLVAFDACTSIVVWSNSRLKLEIDGIDESNSVVAREKVKEFKQWLDR